jgi:hypothetical protein
LGLEQPSVSKHLRVLRDVGPGEVRCDGAARRVNITQEFHVRAAINATFAALLEQKGRITRLTTESRYR